MPGVCAGYRGNAPERGHLRQLSCTVATSGQLHYSLVTASRPCCGKRSKYGIDGRCTGDCCSTSACAEDSLGEKSQTRHCCVRSDDFHRQPHAWIPFMADEQRRGPVSLRQHGSPHRVLTRSSMGTRCRSPSHHMLLLSKIAEAHRYRSNVNPSGPRISCRVHRGRWFTITTVVYRFGQRLYLVSTVLWTREDSSRSSRAQPNHLHRRGIVCWWRQ